MDEEVSSRPATTSIRDMPKRGYRGRALILFVALAGLACSVYTLFSCQFFSFSEELGNNGAAPPFDDTSTSIGLFYFESAQDPNTCKLYQQPSSTSLWNTNAQDGFNTYFYTAQFASVIAPGLAILAILLNVVELGCYRFPYSFIMPILLYLLASIVQCLTLFMYGQADFCIDDSIVDCKVGMGFGASMTAGILYYSCSILLCCFPRPDPCCVRACRRKQQHQHQQQQTQQTPAKKLLSSSRSHHQEDHSAILVAPNVPPNAAFNSGSTMEWLEEASIQEASVVLSPPTTPRRLPSSRSAMTTTLSTSGSRSSMERRRRVVIADEPGVPSAQDEDAANDDTNTHHQEENNNEDDEEMALRAVSAINDNDNNRQSTTIANNNNDS